MKKLIIVFLVLVLVLLGFLFIRARANRDTGSNARNAPDQTTTLSSGGHTWKLGAVIMDGTNVPAGHIKIAAIQSTNDSPQTNGVSR